MGAGVQRLAQIDPYDERALGLLSKKSEVVAKPKVKERLSRTARRKSKGSGIAGEDMNKMMP